MLVYQVQSDRVAESAKENRMSRQEELKRNIRELLRKESCGYLTDYFTKHIIDLEDRLNDTLKIMEKLENELHQSRKAHHACEQDNAKLRGKVEKNIDVNRIDGLDEKIETEGQKAFVKFFDDCNKKAVSDINRAITSIGEDAFNITQAPELDAPTKEEHEEVVKQLEALKRAMDKGHEILQAQISKLEDQVAELEKRPDNYVVNITYDGIGNTVVSYSDGSITTFCPPA